MAVRVRQETETDHAYIALLVTGSDAVVAELAVSLAAEVPADLPHRETMRAALSVLCVLVSPTSRWFADAGVLPLLSALLDHLEQSQGANGLFDGDNLSSPPDTSFTINDLCLAHEIIAEQSGVAAPVADALREVAGRLQAIAACALPALLAGGVHTPNHRWEIASALARIGDRWPDPRIAGRVDAWLREGIDVDGDGFYSEQSPNYAAYVSNPSLMALARLVDRPELLGPVRQNLRTTITLTEADGEVETVQSRRQDQREVFSVRSFLSQYRWFALADQDGDFARVVEQIVAAGPTEPVRHLAEVLVEPILARLLPSAAPLASADDAFYPTVGLARRRDGRNTLSVFGGGDFARTRRIASGLANSAVFLRMRQGDAILDALRVSPQFFDLGAFRASSIEQHGDGFVLREHRSSGYYQPLATADLSRTGEYRLGDEGRFFASMGFDRRELSPITLDTTVTVTQVAAGVDVGLAFDGVLTDVAIELVFRPGGVLEGVAPLPGTDAFVFTGGPAGYRVGDDVIEFTAAAGSVLLPGRRPRFDEGEMFGYVGGTDRIPGLRVLIAARTDAPFTLELRGASAHPQTGETA